MADAQPSAKELRHKAQEQAALEARAKAAAHLKTKNVKSHAEIIAPLPKNTANPRDNTLELVRKRKALQLQQQLFAQLQQQHQEMQQEQDQASNNASKKPRLSAPPPISNADHVAANIPLRPTWMEAENEERPDLQKGAARAGYGLPITQSLPQGTTLPDGWIIVKETNTKRQYFWNKTLNTVSWSDPRRSVWNQTSNDKTSMVDKVEPFPFHVAKEHDTGRSYFFDSKSGKTSFDYEMLKEMTKPPEDEDAPEVGAPEGFMDVAGDIPRWQYLRDKALKEREMIVAQRQKEEEEAAASRKAEMNA